MATLVSETDWLMRQKSWMSEEQCIQRIADKVGCSREEAEQLFGEFKIANPGYSIPAEWTP